MSTADTMARINRAVTNPLVRLISGRIPPWATVVHTGRKSARTYETPVVAFATPDGVVVPLPYGTDRDWVRNVVAAGGCRLQQGGRTREMSDPEIVDRAAAAPLLPSLLRPTVGRALGHFLFLQSAGSGA